MEYTDTQDDFVDETIDNETRKRKTPESDKKTKPKWKSSEIETLIDELEKRSCLWDVFDKDYHNRDKRDVAHTELAEILSYSKQEVKTKKSGPEDATRSRTFENKLLEIRTSDERKIQVNLGVLR